MDEGMDNIVELADENGNPVAFEFLDLIEFEGGEYVVLLPVDEENCEIVILKVEPIAGNDEEENYVGVGDDRVLEAVYAIFKEKFKDEFDFAD